MFINEIIFFLFIYLIVREREIYSNYYLTVRFKKRREKKEGKGKKGGEERVATIGCITPTFFFLYLLLFPFNVTSFAYFLKFSSSRCVILVVDIVIVLFWYLQIIEIDITILCRMKKWFYGEKNDCKRDPSSPPHSLWSTIIPINLFVF